jgi:hypothetical protein
MADQRSYSILRALASGVSCVLILAGAAIKAGFVSFRTTRD